MSISTTAPRQADVTTAITAEDLGKLVLRVSLGVMLLLHGLAKLNTGPGPIAAMLAQHDLPAFLAYAVYVGEVIAPLLLIAGLWTQPAALLVVINMLVAIGLAHAGDVFALGKQGGWAIELQGLYLFGAVAIGLLGAGRISVGGLHGRWN